MSGNPIRAQAIDAIARRRDAADAALNPTDAVPTRELFGMNVFSNAVMRERLPKQIFKSLQATIDSGSPLDLSVADVVASAMKDWALARGATHYAHVFYPLTGLTAEKHDSFLVPDGKGGAIAEFSGSALIMGEPDASSFPSGGLRATFEARGYTAWDVTSPAYLLETADGATLCIPTMFFSWTGEALDKKTPVLRSMQVLDKHARRLLKLFGHDNPARVVATAGPEQEYFLIDRNFFLARPDLMGTGRTLFGAPTPRGQEFEDHYFGAIPERVLAFMHDCERELFKLGIPVKTRHNEVAPAQFEIAPIFEAANVATDHQQLLCVTLKRVAQKHGMECLLHEKPFARVNGSGKHVNFSLGNSTQGNLLDPGDTPHDNAQFLVFCAAIIRAVSRHGAILRGSVASASNDHRLGANEAPPAIMSIFLGDQLTHVFEQIAAGTTARSKAKSVIAIGVDTLPPLPKDAGDRNRTSPFAFTGNRFEFRAVGSRQSIAGPLVVLNTIVAESLDFVSTELEKATKGDPRKLNAAVQKLLREIIREHGSVIFNGDGYSEEWHKEAKRRGLPNLKTAPDALPKMVSKEAIRLFSKYGVLSDRELHSRTEIYLDQYKLDIRVEANFALLIARGHILPAVIRYQAELAEVAIRLNAAGIDSGVPELKRTTDLLNHLRRKIDAVESKLANDKTSDPLDRAQYYRDHVLTAMNDLRQTVDELERTLPDDMWPLPTYYEMMFIR